MANNFFTAQDNIRKASEFGKWQVSKNGDMLYDGGRYSIADYQLKDVDWIIHMFEKKWIDWNEFMPAYFQALKNAGVQYQNMQIFY